MRYNSGDPYNGKEPCQSQKRGTCEPTERGIIEFLWGLLDDIDTAGDMAKGDDKLFRAIVERTQKRRWETGIICDGYKIDIGAGLKTVKPEVPS